MKAASAVAVIVWSMSEIWWTVSGAAILNLDITATGIKLEHVPPTLDALKASTIEEALGRVHVAIGTDPVSGMQSIGIVKTNQSLTFIHQSIWQRAVVPDSVNEIAVILASVHPEVCDSLRDAIAIHVVAVQSGGWFGEILGSPKPV